MNISQHRNFLLSEITISNPYESFGIDKDGRRIVFKVDENGEIHATHSNLVRLEIRDKKVKRLYCSWNKLTTLNVKGLTNLETLSCANNQLTSLNVQGLTNLETLYCYNNKLTTLDVQGLTNLEELFYDDDKVKLIE